MARFLVAVLCVFVATQIASGSGHHSPCGGHCDEGCSFPADCSEIFESGQTSSGVYKIQPLTYPDSFYVYCDMDTDGGGWTIFQRRLDGSVGFYRGWAEYRAGFGNVNSEYWLGNERLFHLTAQGSYELRVDLEDFEGERRYASYDHFRIGDEETFYKLFIGAYTGTAGDSLASEHGGHPFSTRDADHSTGGANCPTTYKGAWWYTACHSSNLNGPYLAGEHTSYADGINWNAWRGYHYSYKIAEMKIRRQ